MASKFNNYTAVDVTTETTVLTAAADTEVTVIGMTIANTGVGEATVNVKLNDVFMLKGAPVFEGGAKVSGGRENISWPNNFNSSRGLA